VLTLFADTTLTTVTNAPSPTNPPATSSNDDDDKTDDQPTTTSPTARTSRPITTTRTTTSNGVVVTVTAVTWVPADPTETGDADSTKPPPSLQNTASRSFVGSLLAAVMAGCLGFFALV